MPFFDYWTTKPLDELQSAWDRVPHTEYAKIGSLKGRTVCVEKIFSHAPSVIMKPAVYLAAGVAFVALGALVFAIEAGKRKKEIRMNLLNFGVNLIITGVVTPIGQIFQLFKATLGLLHPGCYFKEDELQKHFVKLADIAEKINCDPEFIDLLKNGSQIINKNQYYSGCSRMYYYALFDRDLAMICDKLSNPKLSKGQKEAILDMLVPLPGNPDVTGINACGPGLGRILEHICHSLDVPHDPEKIIPWLEALYKVNILNSMAMSHDVIAKYGASIDNGQQEKHMDGSHFHHLLIVLLGDRIGLPKEMIETASQDITTVYRHFIKNDEEELLEIYHELYSEENFLDYLANRINSQSDGGIGLKKFRDHIIQKLYESISDEEIESSKEEAKKQFGLSDFLADDPIYYVKLHYFLHPDVDPSDKRSTDLNEEGIKAFLDIMNLSF